MFSTPRSSLDSSTNKPLKVAFTRFEPETKSIFERFVKKLGGTYTENLTTDTNVLISTTVDSHKYRGACIVNIPVVTSDWLRHSFDKGHFLPTDSYRLPIFKGLTIGVLGFNQEETQELEIILKNEGGEILKSLERIINSNDSQLILLKTSEIRRYETLLMGQSQKRPVVTVEWLKNCLISKQYLKPNKYAINTTRAVDRQSAQQKLNETLAVFQQLDAHLLKIMNTHEVGDHTYEFLESIVVYFHNLPDKLEKIQKKLVNTGGGVYVKDIVPEVTHVITDEYTEDEVKIFHKYRQTKVVDVFWLKDCILYKRLIKADDYLTHPLPKILMDMQNTTPSNKSLLEGNPSVSLSRRNTMAFPAPRFKQDLPSLEKEPARSMSSCTEQKLGSVTRRNTFAPSMLKTQDMIPEEDNEGETKKTKGEDTHKERENTPGSQHKQGKTSKGKIKKVNNTKATGYLFKNINVYFDPKYKELASYKRLVAEHNANVLDTLNVFEEIFYILPDSSESVQIFRKNTRRNLKFVSYRWIDYCLKTKMVVRDFKEKNLVYLFPFAHKVPFTDFTNTCIYAVGVPPYEKTIFKEIIEVLGAKFVYEPSKLTVLVCQDKASKKYTEIKTKYPNIPIVSPNWVFESLNEGKMLNTQSFAV